MSVTNGKKYIALLLLFSLFSLKATAQLELPVSLFQSKLVDDKTIEVKWTMKSNFTCTNLSVEKSTDKTNFKVIFVYFGICGGKSTPETYNYFDKDNNYGQKVYYRIRMGDYGYSWIDSATTRYPNIFFTRYLGHKIHQIVIKDPNIYDCKVYLTNQFGSEEMPQTAPNVFNCTNKSGLYWVTILSKNKIIVDSKKVILF